MISFQYDIESVYFFYSNPLFFHVISRTPRFSQRNMFVHKMLVLFFSITCVWNIFFILRRTERDIIGNVRRSACKVSVILVRFEWNLDLLVRFSKNTQISNFMFKPCIDMTSLNNNQLMHSQFNIYLKHIKSSCKIYMNF